MFCSFKMKQASDTVYSFALAQSDTIGALAEEAGGKPKLHATAKVECEHHLSVCSVVLCIILIFFVLSVLV